MKHAASAFTRCLHGGFTLIEVMIVVAIVGILAAIAYPSYVDFVLRGKLVDGTNGLNSVRADMELHFQDNRTFATTSVATTPCARATGLTFGEFTVTCVGTPNATTYLLQAQGSRSTANFAFRVDQSNLQTTQSTEAGWGAATPNSCWILKRGQATC